MGPQNGILGDDYGTELPETRLDREQLEREKALAKFSKTSEYQKLKEHLQTRIEFYQSYLPDGRSPLSLQPQEAGQMWMIANAIVGEFTAILGAYEQASQAVEEDNAQRTGA